MKASEIGNPKWKRGLILDSAIRNGTGFKLFRNPKWNCLMGKKINQIENRNPDHKLRDEAVSRGASDVHTAVTDITERKKDEEKLSQTLENLRKAMGGIIQVVSSTVETRDPYTAGH